jgi:2-polyprenyl-3-methyl-5-hydroxy-6-metoxy-1,4-benzoquinol methylase
MTSTVAVRADLETRARLSLGSSSDAIYRMVARACAAHAPAGGTLVDVGCGGGGLWRVAGSRFERYVGLDAVRYDSFPAEGEFHLVDLDGDRWPDEGVRGSVVAAVETIEHLENPWAFTRRLAGFVAPGGFVIVTTPNQLSALSAMTLLAKKRFSSFQDSHYPAHKTALLESDICRAMNETGLEPIEIAYSMHGRLPFTPWHYPAGVSRLLPRALSDNVMVVARRRAEKETQ